MKFQSFGVQVALVLLGAGLTAACSSKASFSSGSQPLVSAGNTKPADVLEGDGVAAKPQPTAAPNITPRPEIVFTQTPAPEPTSIPGGTQFSLQQEVLTALNKKEAWVVTDSSVTRIEIDESRGFPTIKWSIPSNWGNRTYVSEIGLLIGRTSRKGLGGIFRAGPAVPQGFQTILTDADLAMDAESRMCVTSFKVGNQAYIGGAYISGGKNKFVRIPIDKSRSTGVDVGAKQIFEVDGGSWGYSCFMDQTRGYFWSAWGGRAGVNVATGATLADRDIPNYAQRGIDDIAAYDFQPDAGVKGSYSMAGDGAGNSLTADGVYTFAHDPLSHYVFGSQREGKFWVTHESCFTVNRSCSAEKKFFEFDVTSLGRIGPMSSLNDGTVVAISRSVQNGTSESYVYLASLKDALHPGSGLNFRKIASVVGDAYMYTDFTGATLYAAHVEKTFALDTATGFVGGRAVSAPSLLWKAQSGTSEPWTGLTLKYRCYMASASTKPAYLALAAPGVADTKTPLHCSGLYDRVDVMIDGDGTTTGFSRLSSIEISGTQR